MRTEIATLGEFGFIRHLTEGIELKNESSRYGVGDDAAVLSYPVKKGSARYHRLANGRRPLRPCVCTAQAFGV